MEFSRRSLASLLVLPLLAGTALGILASPAMAKDLLTIDLANEPLSLDPQLTASPDSIYVYRNIFDNLLTRDNEGAIQPQVASSWSYVSDTEVDFVIRDDILFHDGTTLTAEDVVFSLQRIMDPALGSASISHFSAIAGIEQTGPDTVRITTKTVYPILLAQLVKLSIVPKHYVEDVGNEAFNAQPIGSGAYKFVEWQRGVSVQLERNDDYWGDKGVFPGVAFHIVPDAATRLANLQTGSSDLVVSLNPDLAMQLDGNGQARVLSVLTERVAFLKMNLTRPPMDDIRVRQALAHSIDREAIIEGLLAGFDAPLSQLIPPVSFGAVEGSVGLPEYDPEKARALLAEVGAPAQIEIDFLTSPVYDQRVIEAIQQMLIETGFNVKIDVRDFGSWQRQVAGDVAEQPLLYFNRWSCSCQDADGLYNPILHTSSNWSRGTGSSAETDKLIEAGRGTLDEDVRLENYGELADWLAETLPLLPLYQVAQIYGATNELDWQPTSNESMFINRMKWTGE